MYKPFSKNCRGLAALVIVGLIVVACGSSDSDSTDPEDPSVLSIQVGDDMTFADDRLSFRSDRAVLWFTDRPAREAGSASLEDLTVLWDEGGTFADDPPNAAVVIDSGEPVVLDLIAVEISGDTVTYETETLLGTVPANGDRITLVIDHYCMVDPSDCL